MEFPDGYHAWFLPQESISKDVEKLNELKSFGENDNYKLIYEFWHEICRDDYLGDKFKVSIDDLSIKKMKDIIIKSLYDSLVSVDHINTNYLFNDREPISNWVTNYEYDNIIKLSLIGMRDTFNYLRNK